MVHEITTGKAKRMSFSKIEEILEIPDLIEVQKESYARFLKEGLKEVLEDISPITDYSETLVLEFLDYRVDGSPKYDVEECKERDVNYAAPLRVSARLINKETGEVNEQEVFMGDFPLMTPKGTFIINGAERVIVSQLVRSPGVYYSTSKDKTGKDLFSSTVIPNRGENLKRTPTMCCGCGLIEPGNSRLRFWYGPWASVKMMKSSLTMAKTKLCVPQ